MCRHFLLLLGIWALASALPQNKISADTTGSEEIVEDDSSTTTSSAIITTTSSALTTTPIAVITPPTTTPEASTIKPKSEVIIIKNAADLKTRVSEAGDKLVIIFVMTTWCPHSIRADSTVAEVASATDNIVVLKVVWNKMEQGDWKYGVNDVSGYPSFIFMRKGIKLLQYAGANPNKLRRRLSENITPSV